jgi:hypothetical protein
MEKEETATTTTTGKPWHRTVHVLEKCFRVVGVCRYFSFGGRPLVRDSIENLAWARSCACAQL